MVSSCLQRSRRRRRRERSIWGDHITEHITRAKILDLKEKNEFESRSQVNTLFGLTRLFFKKKHDRQRIGTNKKVTRSVS